ncbi:MAG: TonB-dependent receptor [Bacteroidales bacterium]|nr:TonB-dependent receptor [Bacteroidales bacterium]
MKKNIILSIALTILSSAAFAKNVNVTGSVQDSESHEAESFAVVQFLDSDNQVVAYTMTDENGMFSQSLPDGCDYTLYFSNLGRKDVRMPFSLGDESDYDFGTIAVEYDAEALNAATITAQENLVDMGVDKMTYKVSEDVDSQTSTVLDMLRKVPMVTVDGQDKITVNGSSNFQVLVDGKPNQMLSSNPSEIFKVMPASSVKNIEVITNPGVKYDAEGVGGVLNITTNSEVTGGANIADGQYGTVRVQGGSRGFGGSVFYSAQKGKLSASVNASANMNYSPGAVTDEERIQDVEDGENITRNHSESEMKTPMAMVDLSLGYEIDDQNSISVTAGYMHFGNSSEGINTMDMVLADGTELGYEGNSQMKNDRNSISASADYVHTWEDEPARSLVVSYQFSAAPTVNNNSNSYGGAEVPGFDLTDRKTVGGNNSVNHIGQVDFSTPLGLSSTINTGLKLQYRSNSSQQTNYLWDGNGFVETALGSVDYHFRNTIGAAYLEYDGHFGSFGVKSGLRYEYTWQNVEYLEGNGEDFRLNYGNLVPSASLQWNINKSQNIGLSYNMRISRPGITYLNPYVDITNPFSISYGNTDLKTELTHNVSLVYNIYTPKFMMNNTLRYSLADNGIAQYSFYDADNVLNTTYGNIVRNQSIGLSSFMMITPGSKTRIIINGGVSYSDMSSELLSQANSGWSYNVMLGLQQTLPWDLRLSANLITTGSSVSLQGRSNGISLATAGLTKSFLDDKLSVSINGTCGLTNFNNLVIKNSVVGDGFKSESLAKIPMSQISVSLSYSFGKQTMSMKRKPSRRASEDSELNTQSFSESMGSIMNNY